MIIYKIVAEDSAWESKWFTTRKKAMACMRHMQFDYMSQIMFGKNYKLEMAELED